MIDVDNFLSNWGEDSLEVKELFTSLYNLLKLRPALILSWEARPETLYTLRATLKEAKSTGIAGDIALIDIIDDDPEDRWLTIRLNAELAGCGYNDWEVLPGGLSGHAALCIDVDEQEEGIAQRLLELFENSLNNLAA